MLDSIGKVLRECPPDLVTGLVDRGIMMVGSALLPGVDRMLIEAIGIPVHIAERPGDLVGIPPPGSRPVTPSPRLLGSVARSRAPAPPS